MGVHISIWWGILLVPRYIGIFCRSREDRPVQRWFALCGGRYEPYGSEFGVGIRRRLRWRLRRGQTGGRFHLWNRYFQWVFTLLGLRRRIRPWPNPYVCKRPPAAFLYGPIEEQLHGYRPVRVFARRSASNHLGERSGTDKRFQLRLEEFVFHFADTLVAE